MRLLLLASAGGAIGAGARYLVNVGATRWFGPAFPWSTFIVNVVGCGLMGILFAVLTRARPESEAMRIFLATGVLGGFTTFSAFSLDFWLLIERKQADAALLYLLGSVGLAIAAFIAGLTAARAVLA